MIKPVFLWTDILIFALIAMVSMFVYYARQREHLRAPWRQVIQSRMGMATLMILSFYVLIALFDSMHFRMPIQSTQHNGAAKGEVYYSVEVESALDVLLGPLRSNVEKTYSAPLAIYAYSKEQIELPSGDRLRDYPRLQYGGADLEHVDRHKADIAWRIASGLLLGVVVMMVFISAVIVILARRQSETFIIQAKQMFQGQASVPWVVLFGTLASIVVLICMVAMLATQYHVLGTDKVGQDVLYQTLKSIRTALAIGTLTTLVMLPFALLLGTMAGYFRGWIDDVIQYLYTTLSSIPGVLLIAASVLMLQVYMGNNPDLFDTDAARADIRLLFLCLILGITSWTGLCRLLRGETMKLREQEYVQAAVAFGAKKFSIITKHILPNVMHIVLITIVLDFSGLVLAEAVLSYVGVGVDPSMHSWGNMINSARLEMAREPMVWWSLVSAFIFMFVLVLAVNLFSDKVRDAFDPRMRK